MSPVELSTVALRFAEDRAEDSAVMMRGRMPISASICSACAAIAAC